MAELRSVLTCTICRHEVDAPITFDWLFKPSNFLIEARRDRSTLSLLWTLHAVRDRGQNAFTYAGPTWFWYEDRERGPDAEADLLMVVDGTSIVAEVQSSWAVMRKSDVTALGDIAKTIIQDVEILAVMATGNNPRATLQATGTK